MDLRTGEVVAVEGLLRWPHRRLGLVPPLEFLPLAEESGLMGPLTRPVLDQALAQSAAWRAARSSLAASVNISSSNLLDPGFIDLVRRMLRRHRVRPRAL